MDYPTMGLCLGGIAAIAPFAYKLMPQREPRGVLKDADLERLDERVKLYERVASLESSQTHHGEILQGLKSDNALLFGKLDDLTTLIIEKKS